MRRYAIEPPPAAGATTTLGFDLELPTHGFTNEESNSDVVYNGTFINGRARLPLIGYQESVELERDQDRKKFGLAAKQRMRDRDEAAGLAVQRPRARFRFHRLRRDGLDRTGPDRDLARLPAA